MSTCCRYVGVKLAIIDWHCWKDGLGSPWYDHGLMRSISVPWNNNIWTPLFVTYPLSSRLKSTDNCFWGKSCMLFSQIEAVEKYTNCKALLVPAGCTSLVQPLDVGLNKPFKSRMRDQWQKWLDVPVEEQEFTKTGKRKRVRKFDSLWFS